MRPYKIEDVFREFSNHLIIKSKMLKCFNDYQFQAESWLKAEYICLLDSLKKKGFIQECDREFKNKGFKRIDLVVKLDDGPHYIELKHWFMGDQKGQIWEPSDFIESLYDECEKFDAVKAGKRAWIVALCTNNRGDKEWLAALRLFNKNCSPYKLSLLTKAGDYPNHYFLGILQAHAASSLRKNKSKKV